MAKLETEKKLEIVQEALEAQKAESIDVIDLGGRTIMSDYFVIASGNSNIHIRAIVDGVIKKMKDSGGKADRVEGYSQAKWVLVDYGDVVLHVFAPEEREFYDLETLWRATAELLEAR
jgi:ribosome-associated protein